MTDRHPYEFMNLKIHAFFLAEGVDADGMQNVALYNELLCKSCIRRLVKLHGANYREILTQPGNLAFGDACSMCGKAGIRYAGAMT